MAKKRERECVRVEKKWTEGKRDRGQAQTADRGARKGERMRERETARARERENERETENDTTD